MRRLERAVTAIILVATLVGCALAAGAGAAGGVYEVRNRQAFEELDKRLQAGEISREEYLRRKREIEERSVVY